jgi:8-oxo-dGTP pyrophosphatase MutT (NUDIX family)
VPRNTGRCRPNVVLAVVFFRDKVLMLNRKGGPDELSWIFPGGKIETGETFVEAGVREVFEEAGVICRRQGVIARRLHPATRQEVVYVRYRYLKGECLVREPDKFTDADWMTPEQIEDELHVQVYEPVMLVIKQEASRFRHVQRQKLDILAHDGVAEVFTSPPPNHLFQIISRRSIGSPPLLLGPWP